MGLSSTHLRNKLLGIFIAEEVARSPASRRSKIKFFKFNCDLIVLLRDLLCDESPRFGLCRSRLARSLTLFLPEIKP